MSSDGSRLFAELRMLLSKQVADMHRKMCGELQAQLAEIKAQEDRK